MAPYSSLPPVVGDNNEDNDNNQYETNGVKPLRALAEQR
jgi:hypothetical protein